MVRDASGPTTLTLRYVYFVARRESAVGRVLSPRKTVALSELDRVEVNESESEVVIAVYVRATRTGRRAERVQAFPKEGRVKVRLNTPLGKRRLVHAQLHPDAEGQAEALRYVRRVPQGYGP